MSARSVIEHALTYYGYSEGTAKKMVDNVVEEESRVMPGDDKRPLDRPTGPGKDKPQPPWRNG